MYPLYPAIKPYKAHDIAVDSPHVLYAEETGSPTGIPVIVLHSGPGGGGDVNLRRFFDPECYRIINFDQRGSGRSLPHAELRHNTTDDLLKDIETLRDYFGLKQCLLFGAGFGSLLALLYAEDARHDICQYYARCLQGDNELARMAAAKNWALWEARASTLQPNMNLIDEYLEPHRALSIATLELHYISQHFFITENQVLQNIHTLSAIPAYLIHGRYDMVCPLAGAWELHHALPKSELSIVRDAGHSYLEAGLIDASVTTTIHISRHGLNAG
jgi:proline iminopeptidase